jgi:Fe-S-cluster containining protein
MTDKITEATKDEACECITCSGACTHKPGWFMPGEVAEAAKFLGMEPQAFFDKYLAVDFFEGGYEDEVPDTVFVLAPALVGEEGGMYPYEPRGTCVFYKDGKCGIHAVKPFECRKYIHSDHRQVAILRHQDVAVAWQSHQDEVKALFQHPYVPEGEMEGSIFGGLLGSVFGGF